MSDMTVAPSRLGLIGGEIAKVPAFMWRDFLIALSYRFAFISEIGVMLLQTLTFYFLARIVDPGLLPTFGGSRASYMEFVAIGIALTTFIAIALGQVAMAMRMEQMMGTLESILVTPTAPATVQIGSIAYQLVYIPIRIVIFLSLMVVIFGLNFELSGLGPAFAVLLAFVPFVWGLGLLSAATVVTFKRGASGVGLGVALLTLASGAYFPLSLLPNWAEALAELNPLALAISGMRDAFLGGAGWSAVAPKFLILIPASTIALSAGVTAFRLALRRERRLGTLGLY